MVCPKCKYQNLHGANYCEKCGLDLKAAAKAAANPSPYQGYSQSPYMPSSNQGYSGYRSYAPSPKPTAAPPPTPARRHYQNEDPVNPAPPPIARQSALPTRPPTPRERESSNRPDPRRRQSKPPVVETPAPRPKDPPAFGYLVLAHSNTKFALRYDDNLIGRSSPGEGINPAVDLTAADTGGSVSRRHARIGKDDSSIYVEDLGSSNGSRHNGQPLHLGMQAPIEDGDELVFGSLQMRFQKA